MFIYVCCQLTGGKLCRQREDIAVILAVRLDLDLVEAAAVEVRRIPGPPVDPEGGSAGRQKVETLLSIGLVELEYRSYCH